MATELRFPVEIDDGQAAKELDKLVNKMDKLKENIAKNESARAPIVEQLKEKDSAGSSTKQHCQTVALPQRTVHAVQRKKGKCSDD